MLYKEFHISKLIAGHLRGELSSHEETELNEWINLSKDNHDFFHDFKDEALLNNRIKAYQFNHTEQLWEKTILKIRSYEHPHSIIPLKRRGYLIYKIAAAAMLLILIGMGYWFYSKTDKSNNNLFANHVSPGKKTATLTLSNGKKITLSEALKGEVAKESGVKISKTAEGKLVYTVLDNSDQNSNKQNILSTERGETYEVILPDGSKAWLNSASTLKYPSTFSSLANRKVELNGEAYFEVAKDKAHPFIVKSAKQEIEVMGTHFNISSYADEPDVRTTLLEGSVKVTANANNRLLTKILIPGQQAILSNQKLNTEEVIVEDVVAWKDGLFVFNDEPLSAAMRKISRWYNVDIFFKDPKLASLSTFGTISKYSEVSKVLGMMEKTGRVSFSINGKTITVTSPKK